MALTVASFGAFLSIPAHAGLVSTKWTFSKPVGLFAVRWFCFYLLLGTPWISYKLYIVHAHRRHRDLGVHSHLDFAQEEIPVHLVGSITQIQGKHWDVFLYSFILGPFLFIQSGALGNLCTAIEEVYNFP